MLPTLVLMLVCLLVLAVLVLVALMVPVLALPLLTAMVVVAVVLALEVDGLARRCCCVAISTSPRIVVRLHTTPSVIKTRVQPYIVALSLAIAISPVGCCAGASACVVLSLQVAACALPGAVEEAMVVAKVEVEVEVEVEVTRP
ncbi:hypothetical protein BD410DRAFT_808384 [Rickenella mellea]|uniref:Uncharacterized protein n=1 Tax=Rickenella mellea TaxID=50990 RepID=A0A4Y7PMA9_9AGAM|nr:hypothetical protein BD410DRAFT_808384 [Rickenella mellea]